MSTQKNEEQQQYKTETPYNNKDFIVVGIGASAGGIEALQAFFREVPANSGNAYVVILHLSPDHDSQLAAVLQSVTKIPVAQVTEKVKILPDHIYVIPPNRHLMMQDGHIIVETNTLIEERRAPVDIFFRTLADTHGRNAICVVLSGTGANGSMGLKRVKEWGGAAFVQNPREAAYNEMPRNAISTGLVDEVLDVADIPGKIQAYKAGLGTVHIHSEIADRDEAEQQALRDIFTQLRVRTGHDFSSYKRPTMLRRMERRISICELHSLPAYAGHLRQHPDELTNLLKDLLISVTNFFRDQKAFEAVEADIMPRIFKEKNSEQEVRIWVAGCATGEEAYSLAMLCAEQLGTAADSPKIQIFATDIDETAIARAREGFYTLNDAADVSPERLRRFFTKEGKGYRVTREIQEMILFAYHNFIKDPPFSRLDLITCRNVLIYLTAPAQERVMEIFHFALRPSAFLFLGTAESTDGAADLFTHYSREQHIYQSKAIKSRNYPVPESAPASGHQRGVTIPETNPKSKSYSEERISYGELHRQLLEQYASPSLVVNEDYDVVHITERAARYLQMSGGEPSRNLFTLIRQELRLSLRAALYQASQQNQPTEVKGVELHYDNHAETINIHVRPVLKAGDVAHGFILVLFEPAAGPAVVETDVLSVGHPVAQHLEEELVRLKTQLRSSNEQHEFQAEELKATNEELQAMNEELRSAAEELETSKEELQSINEELSAVNQELKVKIEETSLFSNNIQNLINSTNIGTIFLDRALRVALFTPVARDIFNLIPSDYGRPLTDITSRLEYTGLAEDAEKVLEKLTIVEREVRTADSLTYLMRILPYRTEDDRINGVVLTFFDITALKQSENQLRASEEQMRAIVNQTTAGIARTDTNGNFIWSNNTYCKLLGYTPDELLTRNMHGLAHPEDEGVNKEFFDRLVQTGKSFDIEKRCICKDGSVLWVHNSVSALHSADGSIRQVLVVSVDITERKQAEESLRITEERYRVALQSADMGAWDWNVPEDTIRWNDQHFLLLGVEPVAHPLKSEFFLKFIHPDDLPAVSKELTGAVEETGIYQMESFRIIRADGEIRWMSGHGRAVAWQGSRAARIVGVMYDITSQVEATQALRNRQLKLDIAQRAARVGIWGYDLVKSQGIATPEWNELTGYPNPGETFEMDVFLNMVHPDDRNRFFTAHSRAVDERSSVELEFRLQHPARGLLWLLKRGQYIPPYENVNETLMGSLIDITDRKQLEQQKDQFVGIASHELRTPVTSIKAYAEILEEMFKDSGDTQSVALMQKLDVQVDRLTALIYSLLDTTRITEGRLKLEQTDFNIDELITDTAEIMQRIAGSQQIELQLEAAIAIHADRERIRQVLINLVSNALKYSPGADHIVIQSAADERQLTVQVRDFGIGISEQGQKQIFNRFFRDDDASTYSGLGLGLFISAGIIRQHKGSIWVESNKGAGSIFCFTLPLVAE